MGVTKGQYLIRLYGLGSGMNSRGRDLSVTDPSLRSEVTKCLQCDPFNETGRLGVKKVDIVSSCYFHGWKISFLIFTVTNTTRGLFINVDNKE